MRNLSVVCLALFVTVGASGCVIARPPRWQANWHDPWRNGFLDPGTPVVAPPPPPPAQAIMGPANIAHDPNEVWVEGHYEWNQGHYQWIGGHWGHPPQPGWAWHQPGWSNGRWQRGFWHGGQHGASVSVAHSQWPAHAQHPGSLGVQVAQPVAQPTALPVAAPVVLGSPMNANRGGPIATPVR